MNHIDKTQFLSQLYKVQTPTVELTGAESPAEALKIDKYVKFSSLLKILNLDDKKVRDAIYRMVQDKGVQVEEALGIKREMIGKKPRVLVKPSAFARHVKKFERYPLDPGFSHQQIDPETLTEAEYLNLKGIYRLSDIARTGFLPYHYHHLLQVTSELDRETCGVWKQGGLYYCDFEVFLPWTVSYACNMPMDQARDEIQKMQTKVANEMKTKKRKHSRSK